MTTKMNIFCEIIAEIPHFKYLLIVSVNCNQ